MNVTANAFPNSVRRTKTLLACGIIVTPLFFAVVFIQSFTRAGFNLFNAPLSLLSLGTLGWIQIANFIISGILALACAFGTYRATAGYKGRTLGSLLIGTFGLGLILAGICHPDPGYGFPPGTGAPAGMLPKMSGHATLHSVGFLMVVVSLIAALYFPVLFIIADCGDGLSTAPPPVLLRLY